jgi:hypothetical protein
MQYNTGSMQLPLMACRKGYLSLKKSNSRYSTHRINNQQGASSLACLPQAITQGLVCTCAALALHQEQDGRLVLRHCCLQLSAAEGLAGLCLELDDITCRNNVKFLAAGAAAAAAAALAEGAAICSWYMWWWLCYACCCCCCLFCNAGHVSWDGPSKVLLLLLLLLLLALQLGAAALAVSAVTFAAVGCAKLAVAGLTLVALGQVSHALAHMLMLLAAPNSTKLKINRFKNSSSGLTLVAL